MRSPAYSMIVGDYHPLFREHCSMLLEEQFPSSEVIEAGTVEDVLSAADSAVNMRLVLFGLSLPDTKNFSGLRKLKVRHPDTRIAVVSAKHCPKTVQRALTNGASGYLPKSLNREDLIAAVFALLSGKSWVPTKKYLDKHQRALPADMVASAVDRLTPVQQRVLKCLHRGLTNEQISFELGVAPCTARCHVSGILKRLGVASRTQAVVATLRPPTVFH